MGHPFYPVASPLLCPIHESQSPVLAYWRDGIMYGGSCARNSRGFRRLTSASSSFVINVTSLRSPATSSSSQSLPSPSPLWPRSSFYPAHDPHRNVAGPKNMWMRAHVEDWLWPRGQSSSFHQHRTHFQNSFQIVFYNDCSDYNEYNN